MRRLPALVAAGLMAAAGAAWAQTVQLEPSAVQRCLTGPPEPEYPFAAWKLSVEATVEARLRFDAPDRAPVADVRVKAADSDADEFLAAVKTHVAALRLPCLAAGGPPAQLTQVYVFRPAARKAYLESSVDEQEATRRAAMACVTRPRDGLEYPPRAAREGIQGTVVATARFEAPDRPPVVRLYARPHMRLLLPVAEEFLAGFRMPCLSGPPVETSMALLFRLDSDVIGFKPLTLTQLLGSVRGLASTGLTLDTRAMGCPFDLGFWYRRPHLPNVVTEHGTADASRRPLLDLLRQAELQGSTTMLNAVYGDTTTITVPCLNIAIPPQEKTS